MFNAVVTTAFDRALSEAKSAENRIQKGELEAPLLGLPILVKDSHATAGIRTTYGSPLFENHVPDADDFIVAAVREAGAIVLGKTNIPEFSIGGNTVNRLFGATGNPFDASLTCGGSSGGAAAAMALNMAPLATGSDTGGSLRLPAAFCGVVAHRASAGVVPHPKRSLMQTYYATQGPVARTAADAALLLSAMARRTTRDPMAYPLSPRDLAEIEEVDLSRLRVAVSVDLGGVPVSAVVRRAFESRVARLEKLVGVVERVDPGLSGAMDVFWKLRSIFFISQYHRQIAEFDRDFNPNILSNYDAALQMDIKDVAIAHQLQMEIYQRMQDLFERFDVLVCPGVAVSPFPWKELFPKSIDGETTENYVGWVGLTSALTITGLPITTIPCGLDDLSMPFGLQIVGQNFADRFTLSVAHALERSFALDPVLARPVPPMAESARA